MDPVTDKVNSPKGLLSKPVALISIFEELVTSKFSVCCVYEPLDLSANIKLVLISRQLLLSTAQFPKMH